MVANIPRPLNTSSAIYIVFGEMYIYVSLEDMASQVILHREILGSERFSDQARAAEPGLEPRPIWCLCCHSLLLSELFQNVQRNSCLCVDMSNSLRYFSGPSPFQPHCCLQTPTPLLSASISMPNTLEEKSGIWAGGLRAVTRDQRPHGADELSKLPPSVKA